MPGELIRGARGSQGGQEEPRKGQEEPESARMSQGGLGGARKSHGGAMENQDEFCSITGLEVSASIYLRAQPVICEFRRLADRLIDRLID